MPPNEIPSGNLKIAPGFRLQWEEVQKAYVLLYPEGMVKLNDSSAEILKCCDGSRPGEGIISDLQAKFPDVDLSADVTDFLQAATANGWIKGS